MPTTYLQTYMDILHADLNKHRPKTTWERVKQVHLPENSRTIFLPSKTGAEVGFGLYLVLGAMLLAFAPKAPNQTEQAWLSAFYSLKCMVAFAGTGILLYGPVREAVVALYRIAEAITDPSSCDLHHNHADVLTAARKAKEDIIKMNLAPSDRAYFLAAADKADFLYDLALLMDLAKQVEGLHQDGH